MPRPRKLHRIVNFYIHKDHDEDLKRLSKRTGLSVADLIRMALDQFLWSKVVLDKPQKLVAIHEKLQKKYQSMDPKEDKIPLPEEDIEVKLEDAE